MVPPLCRYGRGGKVASPVITAIVFVPLNPLVYLTVGAPLRLAAVNSFIECRSGGGGLRSVRPLSVNFRRGGTDGIRTFSEIRRRDRSASRTRHNRVRRVRSYTRHD